MEDFKLIALHFPLLSVPHTQYLTPLSPIILSRSVITGVSHLSQVLEIPMPSYFSQNEEI